MSTVLILIGDFINASQTYLSVVYLLTRGAAVHLYSCGSYAGVNMISYLQSFCAHGTPRSAAAKRSTNNPTLTFPKDSESRSDY